MELARLIVAEYHSQEDAIKVEQEFINIFQKKGLPDEMDEISIPEGIGLIDFLAEKKLVQSRGEGKRLIQGGGVKIDNEKISDINYKITFNDKDFLILQVGKRKFAKLLKA